MTFYFQWRNFFTPTAGTIRTHWTFDPNHTVDKIKVQYFVKLLKQNISNHNGDIERRENKYVIDINPPFTGPDSPW